MRKSHITPLFFLLAVGIVLFGAPAGHAASITVRVDSIEAPAGEDVEIPIMVQGAPGLGAMHVELIYDPAVLEVQAVDKGDLLGDNALLDFNDAEPGRLIIGLVTLDSVEGDGPLVVSHFNVTGESGQRSALDLENVRAWEGGESRLDILVTTEAGELLVVSSGLPLPLSWLAGIAAAFVFLLLLGIVRRGRRPPAVAGEPKQPRVVPTAGEGQPQFCGKCGTRVQAGNEFCTNCGQRISS